MLDSESVVAASAESDSLGFSESCEGWPIHRVLMAWHCFAQFRVSRPTSSFEEWCNGHCSRMSCVSTCPCICALLHDVCEDEVDISVTISSPQ